MGSKKLIFLFFILFPFGQILRINLGNGIVLHPLDGVVGLAVIAFLVAKKKEFPPYAGNLASFWVLAFFSLVFSISIFKSQEIVTGFLYLVRFISYGIFSFWVWGKAKKEIDKKLILNSLLTVGLFVAIFGWVQYLLFPDLRGLYYYGWDDHLYRLVSTFLDPAFTGIILALATIIALTKRKFPVAFFLILTLAFTYSRASYLSLIAGIFFLTLMNKKLKESLILIFTFLILVLILPRPAGEGVRLERTNSPLLKITNYQESLVLFKKSPVWGLGFNNLCIAKQKFLFNQTQSSHACSGLDNSFLFILATTGVWGLVLLLDLSYGILQSTRQNLYGRIFLASALAATFHSLFTNTLFYPWVMGWLFALLAISRREAD
jgi:O-antigen ligase